jgi:hypothetical protein
MGARNSRVTGRSRSNRLDVRVAGEHPPDRLRAGFPYLREQFDARHLRHALVGLDHVDWLPAEHFQSLGAGFGGPHIELDSQQPAP